MILPPPRSTRTCTRFPYTTRLRSPAKDRCDGRVGFGADQFGAGKQLLRGRRLLRRRRAFAFGVAGRGRTSARPLGGGGSRQDRKSTRLNSSHSCASRMTASAWKQKNNRQDQ